MGQFIDEVSKINRYQSRRESMTEKKNNFKNELYKHFNHAFSKSDDIDKTYMYFMDDKVCYSVTCDNKNINNASIGLTMEYIDTTYYQQLEKIYKIFKKKRDAKLKFAEEEELTPFYIIFDEKNKMKILETYQYHLEHGILYDKTEDDRNIIKHYKVIGRDGKPYILKIYCHKEYNTINVAQTTHELIKDGQLDGIDIQTSIGTKIFIAILCIPILVYLIFHAFLVALVLLFIFLIILCA